MKNNTEDLWPDFQPMINEIQEGFKKKRLEKLKDYTLQELHQEITRRELERESE